MYNPDWQEVDPEDVVSQVTQVNRAVKERQFDLSATVGRKASLSWYAEHELYEFTDTSTSGPSFIRRALIGPDSMQVMNWTNGPIYTTNEQAPIHVNDDNAAEYVRFFFNYVKGRHGRFVIVESPDEIVWDGEVPEVGKQKIGQIIQPVTVTASEDGKITLIAYMVFKDSLFRANVHVERDGMVSLSDEALVIEGMPIVEDVVPDEG